MSRSSITIGPVAADGQTFEYGEPAERAPKGNGTTADGLMGGGRKSSLEGTGIARKGLGACAVLPAGWAKDEQVAGVSQLPSPAFHGGAVHIRAICEPGDSKCQWPTVTQVPRVDLPGSWPSP